LYIISFSLRLIASLLEKESFYLFIYFDTSKGHLKGTFTTREEKYKAPTANGLEQQSKNKRKNVFNLQYFMVLKIRMWHM